MSTTTCNKYVGTKPWWMGSDQFDPCHCLLMPGHEGDCKCSHTIADAPDEIEAAP